MREAYIVNVSFLTALFGGIRMELPLGSLSGIGAVSLRTVKARLSKREACVGEIRMELPLGSLSGIGAVSLRTVKGKTFEARRFC